MKHNHENYQRDEMKNLTTFDKIQLENIVMREMYWTAHNNFFPTFALDVALGHRIFRRTKTKQSNTKNKQIFWTFNLKHKSGKMADLTGEKFFLTMILKKKLEETQNDFKQTLLTL